MVIVEAQSKELKLIYKLMTKARIVKKILFILFENVNLFSLT
jgi:hypothetical protein